MPQPAAAVTLAKLSTETVPLMAVLEVPLEPKYPALIACVWFPDAARTVPALIVPWATTVICELAAAAMAVARLTAEMPLEPDVIESPDEVVTESLPEP